MTDDELQAKARTLASQAWAAAGIGTAEKKAEAAIFAALREVAGAAQVAHDRLATIVDEQIGIQPVMATDELLTVLEGGLFELRKARDAAEAKLGEAMGLLRCQVTRNPCGTDTVVEGQWCQCAACALWANARPQAPAPAEPVEHDELIQARGYISTLEGQIGRMASELIRLQQFARTVYGDHDCSRECEQTDDKPEGTEPGECPCGGDECWKCAAAQALKPPSWATPPTEAPAPGGETDEEYDMAACGGCGAASYVWDGSREGRPPPAGHCVWTRDGFDGQLLFTCAKERDDEVQLAAAPSPETKEGT